MKCTNKKCEREFRSNPFWFDDGPYCENCMQKRRSKEWKNDKKLEAYANRIAENFRQRKRQATEA